MSTHVMLFLTTAAIASLALLVIVLLIASVLRRLLNERKYRTLDKAEIEIDKRYQKPSLFLSF